MDINFERAAGVETIDLSRRPSTVSIVVAMMGLLLVMQILIVFATRSLALPLIGLLTIAGGSAAWLGLIALESIMPTKVRMTKDGITVCRLLGETTFDWLDVAAAKLVPSGGMLSDDPKAEASGRLAVGLFLKSRKTPRLHALDADYVIYGASEDHISNLLKLVDRIDEFKATIGAGLPDRTARIRKAAPITAPAAFRRPRTSA
jgi:hypothetical protein